jgi:hypothetical protein
MKTSFSSFERDEALSRTFLLMRDHIRSDVPDSLLSEALGDTQVLLVADKANLRGPAAQHALVTTAALVARFGAAVTLAIDEVPMRGAQPPLVGDRLGSALVDLLRDLIPGSEEPPRPRPDLVIALGDSQWTGSGPRVVRLQADSWGGAIQSGGSGSRWGSEQSPIGALAAAGLAAGEAFKSAIGRLRDVAIDVSAFEDLFAATPEATIRLAPQGTPAASGALGSFDCVSGGAITQSALYALLRVPGIQGNARVIEPEASDQSNLNRYALLRRSMVGMSKAKDLARWATGGLSIQPIVQRYDTGFKERYPSLAPMVLVGVDDIPSRWAVQAADPEWLAVGATTHYSAMASYHVRGLGCAHCLHPRDEPGQGPIPTLSIVSHWAGLWLAALLIREKMEAGPPVSQQSVFMTPFRAESRVGTWFAPVSFRGNCPFHCSGVSLKLA